MSPHSTAVLESISTVENQGSMNNNIGSVPLEVLRGPLVWDKEQLGRDFVLELTEQDLHELDNALSKFKGLELDGDQVAQDNFPLPTLGPKLKAGAANIHQGQGVLLIHGMKPEVYSVADNVVLYLGISSYIGDKRGVQNPKGNILSHVTDSKLWTVPYEQRHGIHRNSALPFHNDMGSDILGLQVRQAAQQGGSTYITSAWTVFNDLAVSNPDALATLFQPSWPIQVSGRGARYVLAPLMQFHDGNLMLSVDAARLGPQPRDAARGNTGGGSSGNSTRVPSLSTEQHVALEVLFQAAARHEVEISLATGDILFFNNWAILHRRDHYRDDTETTRHLVRLWLRNSELGWDIPSSMALPWLAAFGEAAAQVDHIYPIEPMPTYKVPIYTAGSASYVLDDSDEEE